MMCIYDVVPVWLCVFLLRVRWWVWFSVSYCWFDLVRVLCVFSAGAVCVQCRCCVCLVRVLCGFSVAVGVCLVLVLCGFSVAVDVFSAGAVCV